MTSAAYESITPDAPPNARRALVHVVYLALGAPLIALLVSCTLTLGVGWGGSLVTMPLGVWLTPLMQLPVLHRCGSSLSRTVDARMTAHHAPRWCVAVCQGCAVILMTAFVPLGGAFIEYMLSSWLLIGTFSWH